MGLGTAPSGASYLVSPAKRGGTPVSLPGLPGLLKQGRIVGETDATCKLSLAIAVLAAIGVDLGENGSVTQAEGAAAQPQGRREGR